MRNLRTIMLAGAAVLALSFVASAFGDDVTQGNTSQSNSSSATNSGSNTSTNTSTLTQIELGHELVVRQPDGRSRWGGIEFQLHDRRCRRRGHEHGRFERDRWCLDSGVDVDIDGDHRFDDPRRLGTRRWR